MDKTLKAVLWAADDDLCVLLNAVVQVIDDRNYLGEGMRREAQDFAERLSGEIETRCKKPRLVRTRQTLNSATSTDPAT
jgi:hypothetical protein